MTPILFFDIEVLPNYLLVSFMRDSNGKVRNFELTENGKFDSAKLLKSIRVYTLVGFNSKEYDMLILSAAIEGWDNEHLYRLSVDIITSDKPGWMIAADARLQSVPASHVDIMPVAPGMGSLKLYAGRLHVPNLQDLPIDPHERVSEAQMKTLRDYCTNDLLATQALYHALSDELALRDDMGQRYGKDFRSLGAARVARDALQVELEAQGNTVPRGRIAPPSRIRYADPGYLEFTSPTLQQHFQKVLDTEFQLSDKGSPMLPKDISKAIEFDNLRYKFGIGGLHSQEKSRSVYCRDGELLFDLDVGSMYPNIVINQRIAPRQIEAGFTPVYRDIVQRRMAAKRNGDKMLSEGLKLTLNSTFGVMGNQYTYLYDPQAMLQVTLTGQLSLMLLIERVTAAGANVISANTDGIVIHCNESQYSDIDSAAFDWELDTGLTLEQTDYRSVHSIDVNNYFAVKTDGSVKTKGRFAEPGLMKNPQAQIIYHAVMEKVISGTPLRDTIEACNDPSQIVTVRKVKGGAKWHDQELGRVARFYWAVDTNEPIRYASNGNKVPKSDGARPLMHMDGTTPGDVDYDRYVAEAERVLKEIGYEF